MDGMLCLALCLAPSFQASQVEKKPEVAVKPVAKLPTEYDAGKIEFHIRQAAQEQGFVGLEMVVIRNGKPSLGFGFGKSLAKDIVSRSKTIGICAQIGGRGRGDRETACRSSINPTLFVPTVGITGTPSFSRRAIKSMITPFSSARSTMFKATTTGICSSSICATK